MPIYVPPATPAGTAGSALRASIRSDLLDVFRVATYGPVAPATLVGPLRPSAVRFAEGVQFDLGTTQRLLHTIPGGISPPVALTGYARITNTPTGVRGALELSGSTTALSITWNATTLTATFGGVTAAIAFPLVAGDIAFVGAYVTATTLTVYGSNNRGALVTATTAGTFTQTWTQLDVGTATGVKADAALEDVTVLKGTVTTADMGRLALNGSAVTYREEPRAVLTTLTQGSGVNAYTSAGTGLLAIRSATNTSGATRATTVRALDAGGAYTSGGATLYVALPSGSGYTAGDLMELQDGTVYTVKTVVAQASRDEVYVG